MGPEERLSIAAWALRVGGIFLAAASLFHMVAAPHIPGVLARVLDAKAYAFVEPIVSFTFLMGGLLLLPLSFSTLYAANGLRRRDGWARWIGLVNALTVLGLPGLLVWSMGWGYFSGAPLFLAGAVSIVVAGLLMMLPLLWVWRDAAGPSR